MHENLNPVSLRDQFAMAAVSGLVQVPRFCSTGIEVVLNDIVRDAYRIADAMLKERQNHVAVPSRYGKKSL